ncbi:FAD-dependent oxidoreductase [Nonomuraea sp. NPDC050783]|uniref:FAD-dependent oxidoreductase n=1 Tax=Nonomuraea sp. NPDC050783 TaxID=3154634 RepID=UPI0034665E7E
MSFHVLIAGGGIGGLCLAQGLRKAGISCAVYESAPGLVRAGYRLHMNAVGGGALRECLPPNLYELYVQTSRKNPRREMLTVIDDQCNELGSRPHVGPPNDPDRPHTAVNRRTLRQIMLHGIEDIVHFGHAAVGYDIESDRVRLKFADGSSAEGSVLVGADGLHSVVRQQLLPEVATLHLDMHGCYASVPIDDALIARIEREAPALLDGFVIATAPDGRMFTLGLFDPRRPIGEAVAELAPGADIDDVPPYMMMNVGAAPGSPAAEGMPNLFQADPGRLHQLMLDTAKGWAPIVQDLAARVTPESIFPVGIRYLAPAEPWAPGRVTLLGDAIHAMPPTLGAGANSALRDAGSLVRALVAASSGQQSIEAAIGAYEQDMREEIFPMLRASADPRAMDLDFVPGKPETTTH